MHTKNTDVVISLLEIPCLGSPTNASFQCRNLCLQRVHCNGTLLLFEYALYVLGSGIKMSPPFSNLTSRCVPLLFSVAQIDLPAYSRRSSIIHGRSAPRKPRGAEVGWNNGVAGARIIVPRPDAVNTKRGFPDRVSLFRSFRNSFSPFPLCTAIRLLHRDLYSTTEEPSGIREVRKDGSGIYRDA